MSWLTENYEKAALGGAGVIALAVGGLIMTGGDAEKKTETDSVPTTDYVVDGNEALQKNRMTLTKVAEIETLEYLGQDLNSFIASPLYGKKGSSSLIELGPDEMFDGFPLKKWKEYNMGDYKYPNASKKDKDKDGFTNGEEFIAGTDPTDAKDHPDYIEKLQLVDSKPKPYRMQWTRIGDDQINMSFTLGRQSVFDMLKLNEKFPNKLRDKSYNQRFKFTKRDSGLNPETNFKEEYIEVEDLKKKVSFKIWRSNGPVSFKDWSAKFKLNTPDGTTFTIPEGGEFSLPYKEGGKGYTFSLKADRDATLRKLDKVDIKTKDGIKTLEFIPAKKTD